MSVHLPNHFGFERLANDQYALTTAFFRRLSRIRLQDFIVGLVVMAAVTITERALDSLKTGFAFEWVVLSAVALITFAMLGKIVARGTAAIRAWSVAYLANVRAARAEQDLIWLAKGDRRVMEDIRAARDRREWAV
jgi:hypothetical protein